MVAELLRLRLRLWLGSFRVTPLWLVARIFALVFAACGVMVLYLGAGWLNQFDDRYLFRAITISGSWLSLAAFLVPLMSARRPSFSVRAFLGYPLKRFGQVAATLLFTIVSPALLLLPVAFLPVLTWSDTEASNFAALVFPLLFLLLLECVLLGGRLGYLLSRFRLLIWWIRAFSGMLLVAGAVAVVIVLIPRIPEMFWLLRVLTPANSFFVALPDALSRSPLGLLWATPGMLTTSVQDADSAWEMLGWGVLMVATLLSIWCVLTIREARPTRRQPPPRVRVPGLFARFPTRPSQAVAVRSLSYWLRDPRYRTVFAALSTIPVLMIAALSLGGVPFSIAVLVPLPVMSLLLGWSALHNDVAYDNTAIWQHIASPLRGVQDRWGRSVPVFFWGMLLIILGVPLTVFAHGNIGVTWPLLGVCLAALLGGMGVGHLYSARYPYAVPHPGNSAWLFPRVSTNQGVLAQSFSLLWSILTVVPCLAAGAIWWVLQGYWGFVALVVGVVSGLLVFSFGLLGGGRIFDHRAPELLTFSTRN